MSKESGPVDPERGAGGRISRPPDGTTRHAVFETSPHGAPYLNVEQDNGPAGIGKGLADPISDPQKSMRDAATSYAGLVALRA